MTNLKKRGLRKPRHRNEAGEAPAEVTVTDPNTGIQYVATGAQDPAPKEKKKKEKVWTLKNWALGTLQSFVDAFQTFIVVAVIALTLWSLLKLPLVQRTVRETRVLHGTIRFLNRNPTETSGIPYVTNTILWQALWNNPENQAVFQAEGGLRPLLQLIEADDNFVLTRLTVTLLKIALESDYKWEPKNAPVILRILVNFLAKNRPWPAHETAASILAMLSDRPLFKPEFARAGGVQALEKALKWIPTPATKNAIRAALDKAGAV